MPWLTTNLLGKPARARVEVTREIPPGMGDLARRVTEVIEGEVEIVGAWMFKADEGEEPKFLVRFLKDGVLLPVGYKDVKVLSY